MNLKTLQIETQCAGAPEWAVLQRRLLQRMSEAVKPVLDDYVREDGTFLWPTDDDFQSIDGLDDAYESFHNWPLLYLLGGDSGVLHAARAEWEAITRQFTGYDCGHGHPMVVKEFEQGYDWFHQGEGHMLLYLLGPAQPGDPAMRERARRFAGFYLNEDPQAPNYDPEQRLVRCAHNGSMGPAHRNFTGQPWGWADWKRFYGLPFQDVPGCETVYDVKNPDCARRMGRVMAERMSHGDVAVNLAITSLMAHAFLYTGEKKYREWVREYVEAWWERARQNGGLIPDNVGLSGQIGEFMDGKWYGGYYGWTWPHGWLSVGQAVLTAAENAVLLTGDTAYLEPVRSQLELLIAQGIEAGGTLRVPYKYGDPGRYEYELWIRGVLHDEAGGILWRDGWFEFQPLDPMYPTHLWSASMEAGDLARIRQVRNEQTREYERVVEKNAKDQGGHEAAWVSYLEGGFPDYPEQILRHNLEQMHARLEFMRTDTQEPASYSNAYIQKRNPVSCEGLVQLTMGGPLPLYNGGLLMVPLRHFDGERRRPGLPPDVSALVRKVEKERLVVEMVNLHPASCRQPVLQAGGFGEHRFTDLYYQTWGREGLEERTARVDSTHLGLRLHPGSRVRLELGMERFVQTPAYAPPWERRESGAAAAGADSM